ncbi:hypothetical protein HYH03_002760 [Edaphochlamys debaryana]|uniref:Uncharacterized protein n=1 Tax=Edaphochlamys debaryana TaxID=47281 RepID=A0A836C4V8_9CHLO|nr:hypothetical protein HYH03_002760 [Edaphochlamys debaryana]|eukprot:KAG2499179.1 hypothetical protein HYH03_002760 [Edaphochlamys debaryana]
MPLLELDVSACRAGALLLPPAEGGDDNYCSPDTRRQEDQDIQHQSCAVLAASARQGSKQQRAVPEASKPSFSGQLPAVRLPASPSSSHSSSWGSLGNAAVEDGLLQLSGSTSPSNSSSSSGYDDGPGPDDTADSVRPVCKKARGDAGALSRGPKDLDRPAQRCDDQGCRPRILPPRGPLHAEQLVGRTLVLF